MSVRQKKYMGFILIFLLISVFVGSNIVKSVTKSDVTDADMTAKTTTVRSKGTTLSSVSDPDGCGGTARKIEFSPRPETDYYAEGVAINPGNCTSWIIVDTFTNCEEGRGWPSSGTASFPGDSPVNVAPKLCCYNSEGRDPEYSPCCDHHFVVIFSGPPPDVETVLTGGIPCVENGTPGSGCGELDKDDVFPPAPAPSSCKPYGASCSSNAECCSGLCSAGQCW
jgi:hypothetical protein